MRAGEVRRVMRVSVWGDGGEHCGGVFLTMGLAAFVLLKERRVGLVFWRCMIEARHDDLVELQDSAFVS